MDNVFRIATTPQHLTTKLDHWLTRVCLDGPTFRPWHGSLWPSETSMTGTNNSRNVIFWFNGLVHMVSTRH